MLDHRALQGGAASGMECVEGRPALGEAGIEPRVYLRRDVAELIGGALHDGVEQGLAGDGLASGIHAPHCRPFGLSTL